MMPFLDKRAQVICDELSRERVRQRAPITGWRVRHGDFITPEQAHADEAAFAPFDSLTMHWYGPDEHDWFAAEVAVPADFEGRSLWLHVKTQIEEQDDGKNPQFLLFVDGNPVQGIDMNHRDVFLCPSAKAGQVYRLDLQAYTGTLHSEFRLIVEWREIDPEVNALYWDMQVPLQAFPRLDREDAARLAMEQALNDAVNLLDLRTPYSEDFMRSVREARAFLQKRLYGELAGHDEVIATCIGHTHIDVAWWWTVAQTREKVCRSFATVLKLMEEYPNYRFMSSQAQLYRFLKERHPDLYAQVKRRVAEGRWEPEGGMWVEADCNLTSGESLVRQFLYGKRFFQEEFGVDCRILWLPDVFGYSGALPQIMKQCGIDYFMTTKLAWNQFDKIPADTFRWRGIDGSEVFTHLITTLDPGQDVSDYFTTYNGKLHPDALIGAWKRYQNKDINNDVLVSYGYGDGGGGPTRAMLETSLRMEKGLPGMPRVRQAFARTYFDQLSERVKNNPRLPLWEGELYFEYHRGTLTSMARNKRANRKAELGMMDLELLCALAAGRAPYPKQELDRLWLGMLINQFHDILPGSAIHEVYEVTKAEYAEMAARREALLRERIAALCPAGDGVTLFNTKGFETDEVVNLGDTDASALVDENGRRYPVQRTDGGAWVSLKSLPSKGYRVYAAESAPAEAESPFVLSDDRRLETPFYTVALDENGLIARLYDKANRREVLREGERGNLMRMYEDKPMHYDNWDIDLYYTEKGWDVTDLQSLRWTSVGAVCAECRMERRISNSNICQTLRFYADSPRIDFETRVDWREHQHLLKVHFPVDVHTDEATFDIQFGNLKRKTHQNTSWDVARFESCGQKWMDVSEGHYGVSLLNDCKYGHSVRDGMIALTLIKSGIEPNSTADQEVHVFTYALYPHAGDWREGTVREGYRLNQPALAWRGGAPGDAFSLAATESPNAVLETIKRAEDGDGWIVRLYECDNARTETALLWNRPIASVESCDCLEKKKADLPFEGNRVPLLLKPYEIVTLRIREKA